MVPAGIVFRSVGYRGVALPGPPFDEPSGTIPNDRGRVLGDDASPVPGLYCAGWIKRGPTGIIGTNKKDATETVDQLLADLDAGLVPVGDRDGDLATLLADRGVDVVTYDGWQAIDEVERAQGAPHGRPRVKLASWNELIEAAKVRG